MSGQRLFVVHDGTRFSTDLYEETVEVFHTPEAALLAVNQNNDEFNGLMPDPNGPGLIAPRPWKAYELVEVNGEQEPGKSGHGH